MNPKRTAIAERRSIITSIMKLFPDEEKQKAEEWCSNRKEQSLEMLRSLCESVGWERGLEELRDKDDDAISKLVMYRNLLNHLYQPHVPFFSIPELANHANAHYKIQNQFKSYIEIKGYLPYKFTGRKWSKAKLIDQDSIEVSLNLAIGWLDTQLCRLYDTRQVRSPYPRWRKKSNGDWADPYCWVKSVSGEVQIENFKLGSVKFQDVSYEEADTHRFLVLKDTKQPNDQDEGEFRKLQSQSVQDVERLESQRSSVLKVRQKILHLTSGVKLGMSGDDFWDKARPLLIKTFDSELVDFLLKMDLRYQPNDFFNPSHEYCDPKMNPGGLTCILEMIGHVRNELTNLRMHKLRVGMPDGFWNMMMNSEYSPFERYLLQLEESKRVSLNRLLDEYSESQATHDSFWRDYRQEVLDTILNRSEVSNVTTQSLDNSLQVNDETTFSKTLSFTPLGLPTHSNIFRYRGDKNWEFSFGGDTPRFHPHRVGFFYLHVLLKSKDAEFSAIELGFLHSKWASQQEQSSDEVGGLRSGPELQLDAYDETTIEKIYDEIKRLESEKLVAEETGVSSEKTQNLTSQIDQLKKYLKSSTRPDGSPVDLNKAIKNIRDRVKKAISRCLESIEQSSPKLWKHLDLSIKTDQLFSYAPGPLLIHWEL